MSLFVRQSLDVAVHLIVHRCNPIGSFVGVLVDVRIVQNRESFDAALQRANGLRIVTVEQGVASVELTKNRPFTLFLIVAVHCSDVSAVRSRPTR